MASETAGKGGVAEEEAAATRTVRRRRIAFYVAIVCLGFGTSMFINAIAGRYLLPEADVVEALTCPLLPPGTTPATLIPATAAAAGVVQYRTPSLAMYLLAAMVEPVYLLASGRAAALALLLVVLLWWRRRQAAAAVVNGGVSTPASSTPPPPDAVSSRLLLPMAIGVTNSIAYACYMALTAMSGVSIWSAMVGCYVVLPTMYGILRRGESRGAKKLAGVAACVLGAVLLGLAGVDSGPAPATEAAGDASSAGTANITLAAAVDALPPFTMEGPWWVKLGLYAGAIVFWSFSDGVSAYILQPRKHADAPPPLSMPTVMAFTALGFAVSAVGLAGASSLLHGAVRKPGGCIDAAAAGGDAGKLVSGYLVMFIGQVLGKVAWYSIVMLGTIGEASSFIPLISLDVFIPALLGVMVLGERIGSTGYAGMAAAAVGVALVSSST